MAVLRTRLTFSNVMSVIAVFIALGGSAIAINKLEKNTVGSKQIKPKAVKNRDLADNAVTSPKVANGSLEDEDFAAGELPRGATGPSGPTGPTGPTGTVDTTNFYDKATSDARFLGIGATAQDSLALNGLDGTGFAFSIRDDNFAAQGGLPRLGFARRSIPASSGGGSTAILTIGLLGTIQASCADPAQPSLRYKNNAAEAQDVEVQNMISGVFQPYASVPTDGTTASVSGSGAVRGIARFNFIVGQGATNSSGRVAVFDVTTVTAPGGAADNTCLIQVISQSFVLP